MRSRFRFFPVVFLILIAPIALSACDSIPPAPPTDTPFNPTFTPTHTPTPKLTIIQCTPPPCNIDEVYYCPDECPGGCGTTCATHTPTPEPL